MRRLVRLARVLCVLVPLFASPARAGVRVTEPYPRTSRPNFGLDFGPHVALSVPTGDSRAYDSGIDAGLSFTVMNDSYFGVGLDVSYFHWPSSLAAGQLDQLFTILAGVPIRGSQVFADAFGASLHVRVEALSGKPVSPWAQLEIGVCRVNATVRVPADQLQGTNVIVTNAVSHDVTNNPMIAVRAAVDFPGEGSTRFGPDVSYRWIQVSGSGTRFTAVAVGGHIHFSNIRNR